MPFIAIEKIAMAAINLIGAAFSNKYRLKDALISLESGLMATMAIPVKLVLVPFKISFQFFAIIINPVAVKSISDTRPTFKQDA